MAEWSEKIARTVQTPDGELARELRLIPRQVWLACWSVIADPSGKAARAAWRGVAAVRRGRMLRASLGLETGTARYRWSDLRARRICALALGLHLLNERTRRRGRWAGGCVRGITRPALCALLRDPNDPRSSSTPSVSALAGTHRPGATAATGEVGYLRALEEAGFCYSQQLAPAVAAPCERFGAYCSNRYWLSDCVIERAIGDRGELWKLLALGDDWQRQELERGLTAYESPEPRPPD
jgi:hypothetical protein